MNVFERVTSTRGRVICLVVVLLGGGLLAAATGGEPIDAQGNHTDAHLPAVIDEQPEIPVVVPRKVPDGYELWPSPSWSTPAGDPGATWLYRPVSPDGHEAPMVSVCIVPETVADGERSCAPDGNHVIARYDDGVFTVFIVPLGPGSDRLDDTPWRDLALTTRWQDLDSLAGWIRPAPG